MNIFNKREQSVDAIVANFTSTINALTDLSTKKKEEVDNIESQILMLDNKRIEAAEEARKAQVVASKIQNLLED